MSTVYFLNEHLKPQTTYKKGISSPIGLETDKFYKNFLNFMLGNVNGTKHIALDCQKFDIRFDDYGFEVDFNNMLSRKVIQPFNSSRLDRELAGTDSYSLDGLFIDEFEKTENFYSGFRGIYDVLEQEIAEDKPSFDPQTKEFSKTGLMTMLTVYDLFGGKIDKMWNEGVSYQFFKEFYLLEMDKKKYLVTFDADGIVFYNPITINEFKNGIKWLLSTEEYPHESLGMINSLPDELHNVILSSIEAKQTFDMFLGFIHASLKKDETTGNIDVSPLVYLASGSDRERYWSLFLPKGKLRPVQVQSKDNLPVWFSLMLTYQILSEMYIKPYESDISSSEQIQLEPNNAYLEYGVGITSSLLPINKGKGLGELLELNEITDEEYHYYHDLFEVFMQEYPSNI